MRGSNLRNETVCLRGRALAMLFAVRVGLRLLPYAMVRRYLRRSVRMGAGVRRHSEGLVGEIAAAVMWASRLVPGGNNCLVQALTARALLAREGIASELVIGVRKGPPEDGAPLSAHAWLRIGERILFGAQAAPDYAPLPSLTGRL